MILFLFYKFYLPKSIKFKLYFNIYKLKKMLNIKEKKYFKCNKCKELEYQLVNPHQFQIKCSHCGAFLSEIPEYEYNTILKNSKNNKNEELKINNDSPYMPSENAFKNISSVYERPPSNSISQNQNYNRNRFNNVEHRQPRRRRRRNRRYQSTNHYSDMNIVNDYNNNYNINNQHIDNNINNDSNDNINNDININYNNNLNNINIENNLNDIPRRTNREENEDNETEERERNYQREPFFRIRSRNRGRSTNPMNSPFSDNFFNNFFNAPLFPFGMMMPPMIVSHNDDGHYRIFIQRQNVPQFIFDPMFLAFGSFFNDDFRNNFSSNFRSNFRGNFLNEIIRILERNQEEAARRAHPPTSEETLKKLKRFPLSDKYCKKDKNGKIELPSCCICLNDIEKNEETVLLPCGHMFHWNCCLTWLKNNNTCPMCRFELKD